MEKTFMFQYAYDRGFHSRGISLSDTKIVEDTDLLTEQEAEVLWDKYYPEVVKRLQDDERPHMGIWKDCKNNTDYREILKEIDWRDDLEVKGGRVFKKSFEAID